MTPLYIITAEALLAQSVNRGMEKKIMLSLWAWKANAIAVKFPHLSLSKPFRRFCCLSNWTSHCTSKVHSQLTMYVHLKYDFSYYKFSYEFEFITMKNHTLNGLT